MAYIETLAPRDWGLCTLFGYPYCEGIRNLRFAFPCCDDASPVDPPSLMGRVTHFVLGVLLLIPLINTVVFLILRAIFTPPVFASTTDIITPRYPLPQTGSSVPRKSEMSSASSDTSLKSVEIDKRLQQLKQCNDERNNLLKQLADVPKDHFSRNEINKKLLQVEWKAAGMLKSKTTALTSQHLKMSKNNDPQLKTLDGHITHATKDHSHTSVALKGLPKAEFNQVGGLSQQAGYNHLCGYYALFFMMQAVTGKKFTDRTTFNAFFLTSAKLIATKRAAHWLSNHRDKPIPYGLALPIEGLNRDDMQYLIEHMEDLAPLRETSGCFMLEVDEYRERQSYSEPIKLMGKSKTEKKNPERFPIFFILKDVDLHYYFVYATEPWKFTFVHSLNYSVLNPGYFSSESLYTIVKALNGIHSPLKLNN